MARKKPEKYAVLTVDAMTGSGGEACRTGSQEVALAIAARLRYEERRIVNPQSGTAKKVRKYERVTTMGVYRDGSMEPVVVG
jgi:hypothetical protein